MTMRPKVLLPDTTWRLSPSELRSITLPSCPTLCSHAATTFAVKYNESMPSRRQDVESYKLCSDGVELNYAIIHNRELGPNNLGSRQAVRGKQRKRVASTAR